MEKNLQQTTDDYPQLKLENQLCFPLYACARKVINQYNPYLKPLGITYTQYLVFLVLWEQQEATVGEICRRLFLDNGTITPLIKKMEKDGYVVRKRSEEDERVVKVSITEKGIALREDAKDIPFSVGGCLAIPGEDAAELYRLLYQLLDMPLRSSDQ
ncbi:MAG: MarR family transcriptional regulator [Lachnospiraceae bacterium]|nr:MarR family transcriptional regulator [Lachnospiraceae bacterium]MBQ2063221.1 MarR family transcriptional regulator [Bacillota bacterium]